MTRDNVQVKVGDLWSCSMCNPSGRPHYLWCIGNSNTHLYHIQSEIPETTEIPIHTHITYCLVCVQVEERHNAKEEFARNAPCVIRHACDMARLKRADSLASQN